MLNKLMCDDVKEVDCVSDYILTAVIGRRSIVQIHGSFLTSLCSKTIAHIYCKTSLVQSNIVESAAATTTAPPHLSL